MAASKPVLYYLDGRGLAEHVRNLFAVAGVQFEDKRYPVQREDDGTMVWPEVQADAAAGVLDCNCGRVPILKTAEGTIGGSKAVARYVASAHGLAGSTPLEAATIDSICECVYDMDAASKGMDAEEWFTGTGTIMGDRQLGWYLRGINKMVGRNGHAVGEVFSRADALIYNKLGEVGPNAGLFNKPKGEPMGDLARVQAAVVEHAPHLAKIVAKFGGCPAMKAYLADRTATNMF